jgi:hypothetical protein
MPLHLPLLAHASATYFHVLGPAPFCIKVRSHPLVMVVWFCVAAHQEIHEQVLEFMSKRWHEMMMAKMLKSNVTNCSQWQYDMVAKMAK